MQTCMHSRTHTGKNETLVPGLIHNSHIGKIGDKVSLERVDVLPQAHTYPPARLHPPPPPSPQPPAHTGQPGYRRGTWGGSGGAAAAGPAPMIEHHGAVVAHTFGRYPRACGVRRAACGRVSR